MRFKRLFPAPMLLVLGFPLIWACEDSVTSPPPPQELESGLALSPAIARLSVGQTLKFQPFFTGNPPLEGYEEGDEGVWWSSDPRIARVDQAGVVVALSPGEVIITLDRGGLQAHATILVYPNEGEPPLPEDLHGEH